MTDFDGARALVTGGGSGIGAAIARRLASDGAEVWVMGRRREALLDVSDNVIVGDVSVRDDCSRAIAECGPLDILINNAGVGDADWERTLAINLTGAHWLAELATDGLCARRGAVVNVASVGAIRAHSAQQPIRGLQGRPAAAHTVAGGSARPPRGAGQLGLPRLDSHSNGG